VIPSIVAGFDTITNHIYLILFPVVFDFLLWLGPHIQVNQIVQRIQDNLVSFSELDSPQFSEMVQESLQAWDLIGQRLNMMIALRSFPVGVPALFASSFPVDAPFIEPAKLEVTNFFVLLTLIGVFTVIGVFFGTFYFSLVSRAALENKIDLSKAIRELPWLGIRSLLVTFVWLFIIIVVSIPVMCISSIAILMGPALGQIAVLLFLGILAWILFPLIFSTHGLFVFRQNVWPSIRDGARLTNLTLPTTGVFILLALVISQVFNIIWRIPAEDSPFAMIGIIGHGFVVTGLLAASFIYYQQAKKWVNQVITDRKLGQKIINE
jgi:hypothetical protein